MIVHKSKNTSMKTDAWWNVTMCTTQCCRCHAVRRHATYNTLPSKSTWKNGRAVTGQPVAPFIESKGKEHWLHYETITDNHTNLWSLLKSLKCLDMFGCQVSERFPCISELLLLPSLGQQPTPSRDLRYSHVFTCIHIGIVMHSDA